MSERPAGIAPAGRPGQLSLFDLPEPLAPPADPRAPLNDPDAAARAYAVDPRHNVVLEASAGTGKTTVLVGRYVNLLKAGVDPSNILAITFTRKAAAEMRERIVRELRSAAARSEPDRKRWLELRDRLSDIAISTIDAFCLSLLREFPLEADVDPAFDLADETEVPRLVATALDRTMRILVRLAQADADLSLVLAQLGIARTRDGLATLLDRRLVAWDALDRFLARGPAHLTADSICAAAARALDDTLRTVSGGLGPFLSDGPSRHPRYELFVRDVRTLASLDGREVAQAAIRALLDRVAAHFLTNEGKARKPGGTLPPYKADHYPSREASRRHRDALFQLAPRVEEVMFAFNRDLNVVLARGVRQMFAIALEQYRRALDERSVLDFSDVLQRALELLRQMDEFSQSRYRLESRYHHVLVDEFQDTSRAQWELVSLLIQAWGEGAGLASNPSIFIVGDRKQSIYRFRDADAGVLQQAGLYIEGLRPGGRARRSIARSFRAVPELLHFVNDVFSEISQPAQQPGEFTFEEGDRFPVDAPATGDVHHEPALGIAVADTPEECARAIADEIARLMREGTVRDKATGVARAVRPGDIGILFRSRSSHREFERELGSRAIPTYVYKGLGFFDADEIKDLTALVRFLARPASDLRAAAFLRSRIVRLSDPAIAALAPGLSAALLEREAPAAVAMLDDEDRAVLRQARTFTARWLELVDRVTPSELLEQILVETAYAFELAGPRRRQAWENVKKLRGLVRRIQNRGYATLPRIADHLLSLTAGDESNAVIEALDSVNLITVHASKGLEFPVVFVVNLARGASAPPRPVRVVVDGPGGRDDPSISVGPFTSETDEAERERERHETRRLLYVALTRGRDRVYLSSALKDGAFVPGRGSLAEVLPESLKAFFGRAPDVFAEVDTLGWTGVSGREYTWRICRSSAGASGSAVQPAALSPTLATRDDFEAVDGYAGLLRTSTSALIAGSEDDEAGALVSAGDEQSSRLLGTLVHRLFDAGDAGEYQADAATAFACGLLRPDELATLEDAPAFASRAAAIWMTARQRPDVLAALNGSARFFEVPFSMMLSEGSVMRIVRGTIDCLVERADGGLTVVEFKTGRPRDAHRRQLDLYVRAVRAMEAGGGAVQGNARPDVAGVLIYL
jgi:ATP-dependent helicase/nuclease subunit A